MRRGGRSRSWLQCRSDGGGSRRVGSESAVPRSTRRPSTKATTACLTLPQPTTTSTPTSALSHDRVQLLVVAPLLHRPSATTVHLAPSSSITIPSLHARLSRPSPMEGIAPSSPVRFPVYVSQIAKSIYEHNGDRLAALLTVKGELPDRVVAGLTGSSVSPVSPLDLCSLLDTERLSNRGHAEKRPCVCSIHAASALWRDCHRPYPGPRPRETGCRVRRWLGLGCCVSEESLLGRARVWI